MVRSVPKPAPGVPATHASRVPVASLLDAIAAGRTAIVMSAQDRPYVMRLLRNIAQVPAGRALIEEVLDHVLSLRIVVDRDEINKIEHDPDSARAVITLNGEEAEGYVDSAGQLVHPPEGLILAHELVHAYHKARSPQLFELLMRIPVEEFQDAEELATVVGMDRATAIRLERYFHGEVPLAELLAYGAICENTMRQQVGQWLRHSMNGRPLDPTVPDRRSMWRDVLDRIAA